MKKNIFRHDLERSDWLNHLYSLLNEGFSLSEALILLSEFQKGIQRNWCQSIYDRLVEGNDFSNQLASGGFTKDVISFLYFNERYGDLVQALFKASLMLKKRHELFQNIKKLLHYPMFLIVCLVIIISILMDGVYPQFQSFFLSMNRELPWFTAFTMSVLSIFQLHYLVLLVILMLLVTLWFRRQPSKVRISLLIKIPYFNSFTRTFITYYFCTQLSPMLIGGFSLFHALKVMEEQSKLEFICHEATSLISLLQEGDQLSTIISEKECYEHQFSSVIRLGEAKGRIGDELERYANYLFHQQFERLHRLVGVLQPVIYGIIGAIVLILFISMMLPIFNIVDGW